MKAFDGPFPKGRKIDKQKTKQRNVLLHSFAGWSLSDMTDINTFSMSFVIPSSREPIFISSPFVFLYQLFNFSRNSHHVGVIKSTEIFQFFVTVGFWICLSRKGMLFFRSRDGRWVLLRTSLYGWEFEKKIISYRL